MTSEICKTNNWFLTIWFFPFLVIFLTLLDIIIQYIYEWERKGEGGALVVYYKENGLGSHVQIVGNAVCISLPTKGKAWIHLFSSGLCSLGKTTDIGEGKTEFKCSSVNLCNIRVPFFCFQLIQKLSNSAKGGGGMNLKIKKTQEWQRHTGKASKRKCGTKKKQNKLQWSSAIYNKWEDT